MTLTAPCLPTTEAPFGETIGDVREPEQTMPQGWFTRAAEPGEPLADEDLAWPGRFRRISRALLKLWGLAALRDGVDTVLTEMITNALEHGGGIEVGVRIIRTATGVWIEVADSAPKPPATLPTGLDAEEGRGLLMIGAVADQWGFRDRAFTPGKWAWAYFAAPLEGSL
jgi:hypothetical protein